MWYQGLRAELNAREQVRPLTEHVCGLWCPALNWSVVVWQARLEAEREREEEETRVMEVAVCL